MKEIIKNLQTEISSKLASVETEMKLTSKEFFELQGNYISKNGKITALLRELGKVPKEERAELGKEINALKVWAENQFSLTEKKIKEAELAKRYADEKIDITIRGKEAKVGALHPITHIKNEIIDIFAGLGFDIFEGPEIEDDYHNFTALNVPADHPARDMQDTFFINKKLLLRTQTSPGQIRVMENRKPPIKVLVPGRVFRSDDDATHSAMFHQMEGLVVDKGLTVCDLYGVLDKLAKELFGESRKTRLRPNFFPFTEPSVELDVSCAMCGGEGCKLCKGTGWIEVLGGGMVHPKVLKNGGVDPEIYSGIAFGVGMDRIAMLKYGIPNIKLLFENDARLLEQFK